MTNRAARRAQKHHRHDHHHHGPMPDAPGWLSGRFTDPALAKVMAARLEQHPVWRTVPAEDIAAVLTDGIGGVDGVQLRKRLLREVSAPSRAAITGLGVLAVQSFSVLGGNRDDVTFAEGAPEIASVVAAADELAQRHPPAAVRAVVALLCHLTYGQHVATAGTDTFGFARAAAFGTIVAEHSTIVGFPGMDEQFWVSPLTHASDRVPYVGAVSTFALSDDGTPIHTYRHEAIQDFLDAGDWRDREQDVPAVWWNAREPLSARMPFAASLDRHTEASAASAFVVNLICQRHMGTLDEATAHRYITMIDQDASDVDYVALADMAKDAGDDAAAIIALGTATFAGTNNLDGWALSTLQIDQTIQAAAAERTAARFREQAAALATATADADTPVPEPVFAAGQHIPDLSTVDEFLTAISGRVARTERLIAPSPDGFVANLIVSDDEQQFAEELNVWPHAVCELAALLLLTGASSDQVTDTAAMHGPISKIHLQIVGSVATICDTIGIPSTKSPADLSAIYKAHQEAIDPDAVWQQALADTTIPEGNNDVAAVARRVHKRAARGSDNAREHLRVVASLNANSRPADLIAAIRDLPSEDLQVLAAAAATGRYTITAPTTTSPLQPLLDEYATARLTALSPPKPATDPVADTVADELADTPPADDASAAGGTAADDVSEHEPDPEIAAAAARAAAFDKVLAARRFDVAAVAADTDPGLPISGDLLRLASLAAHDFTPRAPAAVELATWLATTDLDALAPNDDSARLLCAATIPLTASAAYVSLPLLRWAATRTGPAQSWFNAALPAATAGQLVPGSLTTSPPSERERDAEALAAQAREALASRGARSLTYKGATDVLDAWLDPDHDEGWLGRLLVNVADNNLAEAADVAASVAEWDDRTIDKQIDVTDRAVTPETALRTREHSKSIEATARTQLRRRAADLVGLAQEWAVAASQIAPLSASNPTLDALRAQWDTLEGALTAGVGGVHDAVRWLVARGLTRLAGTRQADASAESMVWDAATCGRLLRVSGVPMRWDAHAARPAVNVDKADPDRIMVLALANPGTWEHALRMHGHDGDLAAAVIDVARVVDGEATEERLMAQWLG